ncbi:MAG TPA: DUF4840 domain-containing protein [Candidatus Phocaeicola caecigallinarum]|nr:DUF4840 domain-containing protein [Candidatus Phocaeicola caecigallinarum]
MKKTIKPVRFFMSLLMLGCALGFTACSDDDENNPQVPEAVTAEDVYGDYTGKMTANAIATQEEGGETSEGTEVKAVVADDTICISSFPIRDIVASIVDDESKVDQIVEAVGDVEYKIGYEPTLAAAQDSISLALAPESLKLSVTLPSTSEEEAAPIAIEVKVEADTNGSYAVENGKLIFRFAATEVLLGEGEGQIPLPNFTATTFDFDMDQSRVAHN